MKNLKIVALVGRPNVGKSRLFNRLVGRRLSIVHDQPGVTRDVIEATVDHHYRLLDTGGIGFTAKDTPADIHEAMEAQVSIALDLADLILFVCDAKDGYTEVDKTISERLRKIRKPVILVSNKVDLEQHESMSFEFKRAGLGSVIAVSAEHGYNFDALQNRIEEIVGPKSTEPHTIEEHRIRVSLMGRPNVGKSSITNRLLNSDRMIVSPVAGTTRESIEVNLDFKTSKGDIFPFALVDTAGRRKKVDNVLEYFSNLRAESALKAVDIVIQVIDAVEGITTQDKQLAGEILDAGKGLIIAVNKWDHAMERFLRDPIRGYETEPEFREAFEKAIREKLFFLPDSPIVFVSALKDHNLGKLLERAKKLKETMDTKIPTAKINQTLQKLFDKQEPRLSSGRRFKVYYGTQTSNMPIRIRLFCNSSARLQDSYKRYLIVGLRKAFKLDGCPIELELRGKTRLGIEAAGGKTIQRGDSGNRISRGKETFVELEE
jgi:GTPase